MIRRLARNLIYPFTRIKPRLLILGAQKAGTTSLYNYLASHPEIIPNRSWKEVNFFDDPNNYQFGMGWYLSHFPSRYAARGRITMDASTGYFYFPQVPELIHRHLDPNIRMIAILREPVDRAYSAWKMCHSFGTNPNASEFVRRIADRRSFAEAISQEISGKEDPNLYPYGYIGRGVYADQIENYLQVFSRHNLLLLDFNRLHSDIENVLDEVTDFVGIARFSASDKAKFQSERHNVGLAYEKNTDDEKTLILLREFYRLHNVRLQEILDWKIDW